MRCIHTELRIDAPAQRVWEVLTDLAGHAAWDPWIGEIEGELAVGQRLRVRFTSGETVRPVLTELQPGRSLEWLGTLGTAGLFSAQHRFELVPAGDGTRLLHSERFSGLLVPLLGRMLGGLEQHFEALNSALKRRVEEGVAGGAQARALP